MRYPCYWSAMYADGTFVKEEEGAHFSDLKKDQIIHFGLFGPRTDVSFSTADGILHIDKQPLEVVFTDINGRLEAHPLTGRKDVSYNDIIQFKDAETIMRGSRKPGSRHRINNRLVRYNIGFKTTGTSKDFGQWWFRAIVHVPIDDTEMVRGTLRFVSEKSFRGKSLITWGKRRSLVNIVAREKIANEIAVGFGG